MQPNYFDDTKELIKKSSNFHSLCIHQRFQSALEMFAFAFILEHVNYFLILHALHCIEE